MVSLDGADGAVCVDVLTLPALVTLPLEWAMCLHEVVVPAILAGTLEFIKGGRGGIGPGSGAPAIVGALGGNKGDPRLRGIRGRGSRRIKE